MSQSQINNRASYVTSSQMIKSNLDDFERLFNYLHANSMEFSRFFDCLNDYEDMLDLNSSSDAENLAPSLGFKNLNIVLSSLNSVKFERLLQRDFFKEISYFFYAKIKNSLIKRDENVEEELCYYFDSFEIIYDYLLGLTDPQQIELSQVDLFMLTSLAGSFICVKQLGSSIKNSQTIGVSSQASSASVKKINSILIKFSQFTESSKLANVAGSENIAQIVRLVVSLIESLKESKCVVCLWRSLTKLVIKNRLFLQDSGTDSILQKLFNALFESLYLNIKYIRSSMANKSQINLQNLTKIIKYSSFLFKIYRSLLSVYEEKFMKNSESYGQIANLMGILNSVLFFQPVYGLNPIDSNAELVTESDNNENSDVSRQSLQVKMEFIKEFSPGLDSLYLMLETNQSFIKYLLNRNDMLSFKSCSTFVSYSQSQYADVSEDQDSKIDFLEDQLLFYTIFVNKVLYNKSNESYMIDYVMDLMNEYSQVGPPFLDKILNLLEFLNVYCSLPVRYLLTHEPFHKSFEFSSLANMNLTNSATKTEFYDFTLLNLIRYTIRLVQIGNGAHSNNLIYYLTNNLVIRSSDKNNLKYDRSFMHTQVSYDLLLFITTKLLINSKPAEVLCFLFDVYERLSVNNDESSLYSSSYLSQLLISIMNNYSTNMISSKFNSLLINLNDYFTSKKYFKSYSLIHVHFLPIALRSSNQVNLLMNAMNRLAEMYTEITDIINQNIKNDLVVGLKKVNFFLQTKHLNKLLQLGINCISIMTNKQLQQTFKQSLMQFQSSLNKLTDKIIMFLKETFKYFEIDSSMGFMKKQPAKNSPNAKNFHLFIYNTLFFMVLLVDKQDESASGENFQFLFKTLNRIVKSGLCGSNEDPILCINSKVIGCFLLDLVINHKNEIQQENQNESIELFTSLLNDSNYLIRCSSLECFDRYSTQMQSNKLIADILRSNKNLKNDVKKYLEDVSIELTSNEYDQIERSSNELIQNIIDYNSNGSSSQNSQRNEEFGSTGAGLDDTMNLLNSMNVTVSNMGAADSDDDENDENDILENTSQENPQSIIKNIEKNLNKLTEIYRTNPRLVQDQKFKIKNLFEKFINSI